MEKETLIVPKGIRYISDWEDYSLEKFNKPHILNKVLTGCGYTEYCITNPLNVILCSPRRILLENKKKHHLSKDNVYYVKNDIETGVYFEKDLSDNKTGKVLKAVPQKLTAEEKKAKVMALKDGIKNHWDSCKANPFRSSKPCKILVTYDSFRHVKEALGEDIEKFYVVVDEFQSIFTDAKFKSNTELEFMNHLQGLNKVCYVSATPMMGEYLEMLDEFKHLPYFELDWVKEDLGRIIKPQFEIKYCGKRNTIQTAMTKIIQTYLTGNFASYKYKDNQGQFQEIQSKEAVFYVNSVKDITKVIKANNLTLDQCNVLVSKTRENEISVRRAFGGSARDGITYIGEVPEYGEKHKMFTFCTRTVYLGADFYSTNARSFIFSNANVDCLSVDISMDLPQILGRQRLDCNPWKNSAELYITLRYEGEKSKKEYQEYLVAKEYTTNTLLGLYQKGNDEEKNKVTLNFEKVAKAYNYRDDYVAVNHHDGSNIKPVFNKLMQIAELRTFKIQEYDFVDRVSLYSTLAEHGNSINSKDKIDKIFNDFTYNYTTFVDKMKFLCSTGLIDSEFKVLLKLIPMEYSNYINTLGIERIKANSYIRAKIEAEFQQLVSSQSNDLVDCILKTFSVGSRYTKAEIKEKLKGIYSQYKYTKTPKASDIEQWFEIKSVLINRKDAGFEIIKKKGD